MIEQLEQEITLLERHLHVLRVVLANEPIGIVQLSNRTDYPHHKVRYSLRQLEEHGLIDPTPQGAIATEQADTFVEDHTEQLDAVIETLDGLTDDETSTSHRN